MLVGNLELAVFTLETDLRRIIRPQNPSKLTGKQLDKIRRIVHPKLRPFHSKLRRIICRTRIIQRIIRFKCEYGLYDLKGDQPGRGSGLNKAFQTIQQIRH